MPSETQHYEKYKHNKKILDDDILANVYNDWKVTIIFYCAVHIIEKFFSKINMHNESHRKRHSAVNDFSLLKPIASKYQVLYMLSIKSRYNCLRINDTEVVKAKEILEDIEKAILA